MHPSVQPVLEVDFANKSLRFRQQAATTQNEAIAKAVGLKKNKACKIIDTTAGLGTDAFILASLGAEVILLERSNTVAHLLRKGLERLDQTEIRARMQLVEIEACDYL